MNQIVQAYPNRWLPGQSGNPDGGSGRRTPNLLGQLKRKLLSEAKLKGKRNNNVDAPMLIRDQIIEKLLDLALKSEDDRVCFAAIKEIFDRTEGKAAQPVTITQDSDLRAKYLTCAQYLRDACTQSGHEIDERLILQGILRVYPDATTVLADLFEAAEYLK